MTPDSPPPATTPRTPVEPGIARWVRQVAGGQDPRVGDSTPVAALATGSLPTRPVPPEQAQVYVCAGVVVKIHPAHTDPAALRRRLQLMAGPDTEPCWVQPLLYGPIPAPGGRVGSLWPRVTVLSSVDRPPWTEAAALLARLHRAPLRGDPPRHGGHDRLARALDRLAVLDDPDLAWLLRRGTALRDRLRHSPRLRWTHGDFHLGHLGHTVLRRRWKLIDVDDSGVGDPAWDLARPAGFWATGLLDDESWTAFLTAYREAEGPAVPAQGDPWPSLELPAQAAVLVATVQALEQPHRRETAEALLAASRAILRRQSTP